MQTWEEIIGAGIVRADRQKIVDRLDTLRSNWSGGDFPASPVAGQSHASAALGDFHVYVNGVWAPISCGKNVRLCGAKGDDTTDDVAAIHAARDKAGAGGVVFFPPGKYRVSQSVKASLANTIWAFAPGAYLLPHATYNDVAESELMYCTGAANKLIGQGAAGGFDGQRGSFASPGFKVRGVRFNGVDDWVVEGLRFINCWMSPVEAANTTRFRMVNNYTIACGPHDDAVCALIFVIQSTAKDCADFVVQGNVAEYAAEAIARTPSGIFLHSSGGAGRTYTRGLMADNTVKLPACDLTVPTLGIGLQMGGSNHFDCLIDRNVFVGGYEACGLGPGLRNMATRNRCINNGQYAIEAGDSQEGIIAGNYIYEPVREGIVVTNGNDIHIEGNFFRKPQGDGATPHPEAIRIYNSINCSITGNRGLLLTSGSRFLVLDASSYVHVASNFVTAGSGMAFLHLLGAVTKVGVSANMLRGGSAFVSSDSGAYTVNGAANYDEGGSGTVAGGGGSITTSTGFYA